MIDKDVMRRRVAARLARALGDRAEALGVEPRVPCETLGRHLEICVWNRVAEPDTCEFFEAGKPACPAKSTHGQYGQCARFCAEHAPPGAAPIPRTRADNDWATYVKARCAIKIPDKLSHVVGVHRPLIGPFAWTNPAYRARYVMRALSIEQNVRNPANPDLVRRLLLQQQSLRVFATMTPYEMFPERWIEALEAAAHRLTARTLRQPCVSELPDGAERCGKCGSWKTDYSSFQTRSADEPMTNFFNCFACGNRWKR